jgi:hypothetical protein
MQEGLAARATLSTNVAYTAILTGLHQVPQ